MYWKKTTAGLIVLFSSFMAAAHANEESTSHSDKPKDIVDGYHISCALETESPTLLTAPDPKSLGREFVFDTTFSFNPDRFVEKDGVQYLEGRLINGAMRVMYKGPEFPEATRDQWYALSSEWDCALYRIIDGKRRY
ncbi:hypothetical protein [Anderseniella sp. Alg231-50]|uniref:hypothetical protein n=1 Tax=Anderseniella sp. Alg231-50 TaxID=1922226 RepID=UPI000D54FCA8